MEQQLLKKNILYIGTSMLDLSKVLTENFHYNFIKNKYSDKTAMLLTDTGRLIQFYLTSVIIQKS